MTEYQSYRNFYYGEFQTREDTLSYAFWFYIYNFDRIRRPDLDFVLGTYEHLKVKEIPRDFKTDLDIVYQKLDFFNSHPAVGLWFTFWHDVWCHNRSLKRIQEHKEVFDPFSAKSFCYRVLPREVLEKELDSRGLIGKKGLWSQGWFHKELLDDLFISMTAISDRKANAPKAVCDLMRNLRVNYSYAAACFKTSTQIETQLASTFANHGMNWRQNSQKSQQNAQQLPPRPRKKHYKTKTQAPLPGHLNPAKFSN